MSFGDVGSATNRSGGGVADERRRSVSRLQLRPIRRRGVWIASGFFVQLVAVAIPVARVLLRAKHEAAAGLALRATVLSAAQGFLASPAVTATVTGSAVLFMIGSVVLARPFARSVTTLLVGVPIASLVGAVVLGAVVLVVAVVVVLVNVGADVPTAGGRGREREREREGPRGRR